MPRRPNRKAVPTARMDISGEQIRLGAKSLFTAEAAAARGAFRTSHSSTEGHPMSKKSKPVNPGHQLEAVACSEFTLRDSTRRQPDEIVTGKERAEQRAMTLMLWYPESRFSIIPNLKDQQPEARQ